MSVTHPLPSIAPGRAAAKASIRVAEFWPAPPEKQSLRRPTATHGRAVEVLGHAIGYLVDSRLACWEEFSSPAVQEAIQLLSRANREVFAGSPEVEATGGRIRRWLQRRLRG